MKFEIENILKYKGEDLILLTGCPGSRWSSTYNFISINSAINITDQNDENSYHMTVKHVDGRLLSIGNHKGTYWGPYHQHGHRFDRLYELSKTEILKEVSKELSLYPNIPLKERKNEWDGLLKAKEIINKLL